MRLPLLGHNWNREAFVQSDALHEVEEAMPIEEKSSSGLTSRKSASLSHLEENGSVMSLLL